MHGGPVPLIQSVWPTTVLQCLQGGHWAAESGLPQCQHLPLVSISFSPSQTAGSAAHSIGSGQQCWPVHASSRWLTPPSPGRGQGAHSVGQGLSVTAAPTSCQHSPVCHLSMGSASLAPVTLSIYVSPCSMTHSSLASQRGLAPTV